jgi:hypothetical protein
MNDKTQIAQRDNIGVARSNLDSTRRVTLTPAVDIIEDSHGITLWADLPGVPRDKLAVKVHDGRLYIEAEAAVPTPGELRLHHAEIGPWLAARGCEESDNPCPRLIALYGLSHRVRAKCPRSHGTQPGCRTAC